MTPRGAISEYFSVLEAHAEPTRDAAWALNARELILSEVAAHGPAVWYSPIEIVKDSGIFTSPNAVEAMAGRFFETFGVGPADLQGKRVLDIGAFSGAMTFFAEDCGADVTALDIQEPNSNGFGVLHRLRRSHSRHVVASVYDLHPDLFGSFDIIIFSGVHYHLKHPLLALERINSVMVEGGKLLTMGTAADFWLHVPTSMTEGVDLSTISGPMLGGSLNDIPLLGFYKDDYREDSSNWFIPNTRALAHMVEVSGFETTYQATFSTVLPMKEQPIAVAVIASTKVSAPRPEYAPDVYAHLRRLDDDRKVTSPFSLPTWYELESARRAKAVNV